ncbi:hypothetical protein SDC9_14773 [bioreactor metagenome]|uniref:SAF domain-containing protein n=1 Tax=bioreactor metagenome TaxID=1076179 RepID=A0A644TQ76_9ZZZZ|nr:Flp pilus assembly protein CpaB [Negativicutes bacterium]
MLKLSNKGLLAIALVFSLLAALLVYNYLQKAGDRSRATEGIPVVVAKAEIAPKTKITPEMVEITKMPAEYIQPGAIQNLDSVIGVIVREKVVSGEQIIERRLVREGRTVGFTGIIPRDKRALTVPVNEVTGVAGFIKPGDYVDVIVTFEQALVGDNVSHIMLQNILVLAANRDAENGVTATAQKEGVKEAIKTATVTLAVSPDEASRLTLAHEKGKINLALRPYLPLRGFEITNTITPKDLVGLQVSPVNHNRQSPPRVDNPPPYQPIYITDPAGAAPTSDGKGIKVIRGTKTESVPLN